MHIFFFGVIVSSMPFRIEESSQALVILNISVESAFFINLKSNMSLQRVSIESLQELLGIMRVTFVRHTDKESWLHCANLACGCINK